MVRVSDATSTFVQESQEDIQKLNNALLDLEDDPESSDAIETVFRVAHNLKGNFGVMGYTTASNLAHAIEDLLDCIRDGELAVTAERMDLIFSGVDHLARMVEEISDTGETNTDPAETIEAIRASIDEEAAAEAGDETEATDGSAANADAVDSDRDVPLADLAGDVDLAELEAETSVYRAALEVADTGSPQVDAMFVIDSASDEFELLRTVPSNAAIEDGEFDAAFDAYVATTDSDADRDSVASFFEDDRYVEGVSVAEVTDEIVADERDDGNSDGDDGVEDDATDEITDADADADESTDGDSDSTSESSVTHSSKEVESIRVDVEQVDQLYNQVEEMVTSRIKLRKIIEGSDLVEAEDELEEHGKITASLQDTVLEIRLVPLKKIVGNFPRVVRDLAREQNKEIDFRMEGVDIEMDRSILNELSDPLMHLIRNAVDHGIESPEERERKGKPREGTITLSGERERDRVSVTVEDDGGGLDVEKIRSKAVEQGIMSEDEVALLDDSEVYDLIFHPGFSTTDEVTEVSGRGVGMDVVNQVVRGVDGSINVESEPDEGTSITLMLPVSVAIVRVLFVTAGDETYGIPIKNIDEISEFEDVTLESVEGRRTVTHDNKVYPLLSLGDRLDVPDTEPDGDDMVVRIKEGVRQVCVRCSDVIGQEEVVIKPFEGVLSGAPGISGASVLGEGEVVMILDVDTL
ncbi:chemotaxis protein CheA [Natrialba asiatica]|uniref:Chemotaxis protein CheA n=1 Tax=Natrialba asiatica (strain ATCC 700177 / DSM 12278 / JCM 9576 / FERM P-10747 / NBRC 102637 / 172P1) TaxID=29540 RepID=M0ALH9_NATA1|nr:chemotaxis protein CheA [Natrialba asiatica]ELY99399.1 CheA signal transduction histidine kinase [Natrialba asiatica DSM 12278]